MGVSREVVEGALSGLDEEALAYRAASEMLRRLGQADRGTFRKKLAASLRRRGFDVGATRVAIERLCRELPDSVDSHVDARSKHEQ